MPGSTDVVGLCAIVPIHHPVPAVRAFEADILAATAELDDRARDQIETLGDTSIAEVTKVKTHALTELEALRRATIEAFVQTGDASAVETDRRQIWRIVGHNSGLIERFGLCPFTVLPDNQNGNIVDVKIEIREGKILPDAASLKSEIDTAANIIRTVMAERIRRLSWFAGKSVRAKIMSLQSEYFRQLTGLAKVGLETSEPTRLTFAHQDLERLKALFTLREAGVVKNDYVWRLLAWTVAAVAVCIGLYVLASAPGCTRLLNVPLCHRMSDLRNFDLLAAGTAIGTWLSFSLRTPTLSFVNLAVLEPDRLNPLARIIFMIGLSGTLGLLLFTGAVKAGLGDVEGLDALHIHGSWALLLGLLSGIAERALGSAVSQTGAKFVGLVGGDKKAAP